MPDEDIKASYSPSPLNKGENAEIEIIYPNTENTAIVGWGEPVIEIIEGEDIVEITGLKISALKAGNAKLQIKVIDDCAFMGVIIDHPEFITELKVEVDEE